ncbi:hypothetical protein KAI58_02770 [Candidatus Gracilibacteria bacterium]|nr:hypothetical protein [Candidatus Gracilibacteria bacterium]
MKKEISKIENEKEANKTDCVICEKESDCADNLRRIHPKAFSDCKTEEDFRKVVEVVHNEFKERLKKFNSPKIISSDIATLFTDFFESACITPKDLMKFPFDMEKAKLFAIKNLEQEVSEAIDRNISND